MSPRYLAPWAVATALVALVPASPARTAGDPTPVEPTTPGELVIHFLDVGQGDGILLRLPDGKQVLIDGGKPEERADDQLRELGVRHLDLLLATHADYDHAGIHEDVLREFGVDTYITNGLAHTTQVYRRTTELAAAAVEQGELQAFSASDFEPGQDIGSGGVELHLMPPPPGAGMEQNDNSVGLVVVYGAFKAVLTGDSGPRETEAWLFTGAYDELLADADVYKAAHHGSKNGDVGNYSWLSRLDPDVVVICVGHNSYGHPTAEAMSAYRDVGARSYRTDEDGGVTILVREGGSYTVVAEGHALAVAGRLRPTTAEGGEGGEGALHFRGDGSTHLGVAPAATFDCPDTHPFKGNRGSRGWIYHAPDSSWYARTKPEECFASPEDAQESGYRAPRR